MKAYLDKIIKKYGLPEYRNYDKKYRIENLEDAQEYLHRYHKHSIILKSSQRPPKQMAPEVKISSGVLRIKFYGSGTGRYISRMQKILRENLDKNILIDLRECNGGNLWYLLRSLEPILDNATLLRYVQKKESNNLWMNMVDGEVIFGDFLSKKLSFDGRIAVLVGKKTASSGEILADIFTGRKNARLFGEKTAGYNTANQMFTYEDYEVHLPVAYIQNINGRVLPETLTPVLTSSPVKHAMNYLKDR